jgi:hypothetical protein
MAREIFLDWLKGIVQESIVEAPETIWHYTTAQGLLGILSTDRLWASDSVFLNDAAERTYGIELMLNALADIETDDMPAGVTDFILGLVHPEQGILRPWLDNQLRLFVTCFCSKGDLLSQWRAYAGSGGYAVGFTPPGPLPAWAQSAPHYLTLRQVIYDEGRQRQLCTELVAALVTYLREGPDEPERRDGFARELVNGIAEIATWCKHPAFAEEQEWRLAYLRTEDLSPLELKHRAGPGVLVPYVELPVPRRVGTHADVLPISHIRCGPSLEPATRRRGVLSLLKAIDRYGDVTVEASTAPARL